MPIKNPLGDFTPEKFREGKTKIIPSLPKLLDQTSLHPIKTEIEKQISVMNDLKLKVERGSLPNVYFMEVDQQALDRYNLLLEKIVTIMDAEKDFVKFVANNFYYVDVELQAKEQQKVKTKLKDLLTIKADK